MSELQLELDLIGPQLVLVRQFKLSIKPWKPRRVETLMYGVVHSRGSRITTLDSRIVDGGFEINTFPANKHGFDLAMKMLESRECSSAWMGRLERRLDDPKDLQAWVESQLQLKAFKRIK